MTAIPDRSLADRAARRRRVAVAGHEGDADTARAHLDDDDGAVRATALRALWRCASLTAGELAAAVDDPAPEVRRTAGELVAGWPADDEAVSVLALLDDADATVAETGAWAAGERLPAEAGALERLLGLATDHGDALVREAAVAALGSIGDERARPVILAALHDKATVRRRAVIALAPFDGPEVDAALERARHDRDAQVRAAAEDLLFDGGPDR